MTPLTKIIIGAALAADHLSAKDKLDRATSKFWNAEGPDRDREECGERGLTRRELLDMARTHEEAVAAAIREFEALP